MTAVTNNAISIGELARQSGLSTHALRFYEAQGILQPVGRTASGHRQYRHADVLWLAFVLRLKQTGMPLAEIRQYAALRAAGEETLEARLAMLKRHRERLAAEIEALSNCAGVLDEKISTYRAMLAEASGPTGKVAQ